MTQQIKCTFFVSGSSLIKVEPEIEKAIIPSSVYKQALSYIKDNSLADSEFEIVIDYIPRFIPAPKILTPTAPPKKKRKRNVIKDDYEYE